MHIWIFNHYAGTPGTGGGTRHFDIGRELVRAGHRVTVFASSFSHSTRQEERLSRLQLLRRQRIDGVRFVWVRTLPYRTSRVARAINMISYAVMVIVVQASEPRPDVIVGSSVHPLAAVAARVTATLRGARFVFEVRDLWPQTLVDLGTMSDRSSVVRVLRVIERRLYASADWIITLLGSSLEYIGAHGGDRRRVTYIPNGVALDDHQIAYESDIPETILDWCRRHAFVGAYTGTMGRANGLSVAVEAASILRARGRQDIGVLLVGGGPERSTLQKEVGRLGLTNVCVAPPIPKTSIRRLLEHVDAGILHLTASPVYRHGISPNKLFDYLAAARPVLFAVDLRAGEVLDSGALVHIPPGDPSKFAGALEALADMPASSRQAMGVAGRDYVEKRHNTRELARRFEDVVVKTVSTSYSAARKARRR